MAQAPHDRKNEVSGFASKETGRLRRSRLCWGNLEMVGAASLAQIATGIRRRSIRSKEAITLAR
jgi:hypothetical protein